MSNNLNIVDMELFSEHLRLSQICCEILEPQNRSGQNHHCTIFLRNTNMNNSYKGHQVGRLNYQNHFHSRLVLKWPFGLLSNFQQLQSKDMLRLGSRLRESRIKRYLICCQAAELLGSNYLCIFLSCFDLQKVF